MCRWIGIDQTRPTVIALTAIALTGLLEPAVAQGRWPITEFEVVTVRPSGMIERDLSSESFFDGVRHDFLESLVRELREVDVIDPDFYDGFETVALLPETKAAVETYLREAAGLLDLWGFPRPALEPVVTTADGRRAYRVYLITGIAPTGHYVPRVCVQHTRETVLVLNAAHILDAGRLKEASTRTLGHELFHAVQHGTAFFGACGSPVGDWIMEGQASAVGFDLARMLRQPDFTDLNALWGQRQYSLRLPVPGNPNATSLGAGPAYRTASFWRYLAEYQALNSPPGPGANPVDYSYLSRLLEMGPTTRDCVGEDAQCAAELRWLEAGLRTIFRSNLRDVYARFIDAYSLYGVHRFASEPIWWRSSFANAWIGLRPKPDSLQHREPVGLFRDVAARLWELDLEGFKEAVTVAVTVEARPGEAGLENLTALIGGEPIQVMPADVEIDPKSGVPRATWYYRLPDDTITPFLLTNVADEVTATRPLEGLQITFTALESYVSMATGNGAGGASLPSDFAAFPIQLDWLDGMIAPTPPAQRVHPDACSFVLNARNTETGDLLELRMDHVGPIRPGIYHVSKAAEPEFLDPEKVPGSFTGGFALGARNPMSGGYIEAFWLESGIIEITSVAERLVQGVVRASGWRKPQRRDRSGNYVPHGRAQATVEARFAFVANLRGNIIASNRNATESALNTLYARTWSRMAYGCMEQPPTYATTDDLDGRPEQDPEDRPAPQEPAPDDPGGSRETNPPAGPEVPRSLFCWKDCVPAMFCWKDCVRDAGAARNTAVSEPPRRASVPYVTRAFPGTRRARNARRRTHRCTA